MAIYGNFKGTTKSEFKLGKSGPRFWSVSSGDPAEGDYFFDASTKQIYVWDSSQGASPSWQPLSDFFTELTVDDYLSTTLGNIDVTAPLISNTSITANAFIGDGSQLFNLPSDTVDNTIYIQTTGNDQNSGLSWGDAVATFEKALELANARQTLTVIEVAPGRYETQGHLDMPDDTIIKATHRAVVVEPAAGFEEKNVFRMGSGCFIEGILFEGWRLDSLDNPTEGFAACFRPGAVIRRAPYIHKVAVRTPPTWDVVPPPLDRANANPLVGRGAGVILADGSVCSPYSIFPNIMAWGATPVTHNGIGYCAKNGALINAVNAVSMWCHKHFLTQSGGQIILSSCATQFGDFTMVSEGSRDLVQATEANIVITIQSDAANLIYAANTEIIIDDMWTALDTTTDPETGNVYTAGWDADDELYTRRDAGTFIQSLTWVLQTGNEQPMLDFAEGLFDFTGNEVFTADKLSAFVFSFEFMRDEILDLLPSPTYDAARAQVTALVEALNETITNPTKVTEPSVITAIGHTWTAIMAGVALTKIPPARNLATIEESIRELTNGVVIASGQDDQGSALFIGGMKIDSDTGELSGPPFESAVNRIATRAAIARSF
jgi:hypothetical protein